MFLKRIYCWLLFVVDTDWLWYSRAPVTVLIWSDLFLKSSTANRREIPALDATQRRVDRPVYQTRPRPQDIRASRQGAAEEPLPGARRGFLLTPHRLGDFQEPAEPSEAAPERGSPLPLPLPLILFQFAGLINLLSWGTPPQPHPPPPTPPFWNGEARHSFWFISIVYVLFFFPYNYTMISVIYFLFAILYWLLLIHFNM